MRRFIFPQGRIWVLDDSKELAIAALEGGDTGILVFTDDDLAATYASDNALRGKVPRAIPSGESLIEFLNWVKKRGVTHVVIDHAVGRKANEVTIDKAIKYVRKQIG